MSLTLNVLTESDYSNGIPAIWDKMLRFDAVAYSVTKKFEGAEGSKQFIIRKDDPSKTAGDTFHFQTLSRLVGKGKAMTSQLEGYEEKPTLGQFDLTVTQTRHAVAYKDTLPILSLYKPGEWARPKLAEWFARRMDFNLFKQLITTDVQKVVYAGNATSVSTLQTQAGSIYSLNVASLRKANASLEAMGAEPIQVIKKNGEMFPIYGAFVSNIDKWNLMQDPAFVKANELAAIRGDDNAIFTGAFGMLGQMALYNVPSIRGDGSPIRPEAKIYGVHSAAVTTITVGSDTTGVIDYTEFFDSAGTLSILGENGAIEYVTYTAKTTYSFTTCTRGVTYGDVTSTAAAYTGGATNQEWVTQNHTQSNIICFGAQGAMRAFAQNMTYIEDKRDYGQEVGIGISFISGHKGVRDSGGLNRGYLILKANSQPFDAAA